MNYFFTGIAGHGMNGLAFYLKAKGHEISGSDRSFDLGQNAEILSQLKTAGIKIFPQDGSGVEKDNVLVYTRSVEHDTADRMQAKKLGIKEILRTHLLGEILSKTENICIAGTSGKTTTTSLVGYVLTNLKADPTIFCGSEMRNFNSHIRIGKSNLVVIETDESGKSDDIIFTVPPKIALAHNISLDHHPIAEIIPHFQEFINKSSVSLLNMDCPYISKLNRKKCKKIITYGVENSADIQAKNIKYNFDSVEFCVDKIKFQIPIPGKHNVSNALGMIAICKALGFELSKISKAIKGYKNPAIRFDILGQKNGIWVVNDFAHNGDKISALLNAVKPFAKRIIGVFQPHGVAPVRMMIDDYIKAFSENTREQDRNFIAEIYMRESVENADYSSKDIIEGCKKNGIKIDFLQKPEESIDIFPKIAKEGDVILVFGARNPDLPLIAKKIFDNL
ncbi:MAG: Mur ligase family protein [Alphaproteobacteria bacterium]|nr:MAG: hypothetical protein B6I23_02735 [Rickettsiaceae bacterium 4572_127]